MKKENIYLRNLEQTSSLAPASLSLIRRLKKDDFIEKISPFWWSIDYSPDPREYVPFPEFKKRLVHIGESQVNDYYHGEYANIETRDVYLYPRATVPMTVLDLDIEGKNLQFFVSVRPYHKDHIGQHHGFHTQSGQFIDKHSLKSLPKFVQSGGAISLYHNFYPHIRGLYGGKRGDHLFWYSFGGKGIDQVTKALEEQNLSFIEAGIGPHSGSQRTYSEVWEEFEKKEGLIDFKRTFEIDFEAQEVSAEEFIEDHQNSKADLKLYYPLRLPGLEHTLPLIITNKTHKASPIKKPVVLGVYAENGSTGWARRHGILRIKDPQLAGDISAAITADFGISVDTVLFTPKKGTPKYERISA